MTWPDLASGRDSVSVRRSHQGGDYILLLIVIVLVAHHSAKPRKRGGQIGLNRGRFSYEIQEICPRTGGGWWGGGRGVPAGRVNSVPF